MENLSNLQLLSELKKRLTDSENTIAEQRQLVHELSELNKKLEKSEEMKSQFLSNIKNEINNPLASILALSKNIITKYTELNPEARKSLKHIYNEAHSLDFQLSNIILAAELEAGQSNPQPVRLNVHHVIETALAYFDNLVEKKKLQIALTGDSQVHFLSDSHYLKAIIANLLSNAIKFSHEGTTVEVYMEHTAENLVMRIVNQGKAINSAELSRIFDRFTQLESGTRKSFGGHGLGLAIVKELVDLLGGQLHISSQEKGTQVEITLPNKINDARFHATEGENDEILFEQSF
ncbi:HAMP domain-containing sensor histidine kinase [Cytophagales bacterium LB-30]|uniref:histidine kinase n=1 Tax=Shiella aurantiaca TaxID=3058365 RepID=A0ABT8F765_9BACT|nr:HAMP domain-containing sensor histidine kinase [Shiella aurantiaca]MDN4166128.1 HAMP domain-containing sensor histidine kinase [Shiella aurantiaca]